MAKPTHTVVAASARQVEFERGNLEVALGLTQRAVAAFDTALGPDSRTVVGSLNDLVRTRLALGRPDTDCAIARRALHLSQAESAPERPESQYQLALLGACRVALGERDGLDALRAALTVLQTGFGHDDRRTRIVERLLEQWSEK